MEVSQSGGGPGRTCQQSIAVLADSADSRVIFIRDNDSEEFWSVGHFPSKKPFESFQAAHGLGYSTISSTARKIDTALTFFLPPDDECEIWQIKISNTERKKRRLSIFVFADFVEPGNVECQLKNNGLFISSKGAGEETLRYLALDHAVDSYDTDRESFVGEHRTIANPRAVEDGKCARSQVGSQPIGVLQRNVTLGANAVAELLVMVGAQPIEPNDGSHTLARASAVRKAETLIEKYRRPNVANSALEQIKKFWQELSDNVSVNSPDDFLNLTESVWGKYQSVTSFLGSGQENIAVTAQQTLAVLPLLTPAAVERTEQILAQLQKDGRTESREQDASTAAWLIIAASGVLKETGKSEWLKKQLPYADSGSGSILEHLIRAAEYCVETLDRKGLTEESGAQTTAAVSLVAYALKELLPVLEENRESHAVRKYSQKIEEIGRLLSTRMWDGGWYLAARNHSKIGSKKNSARKIDLAAQVWPVLAGLATSERSEKALNSAWRLLNGPAGLASFAPPYPRYDTAAPESRFAPGEQANGGVDLSLAALSIFAETNLGRGDLAYRIFQEHNFCYRGENQTTFKTEPFAYPGYIFGPAHSQFGRGDQPWSELSASWMWRAVLEQILGVKPTLHGLKIDPCVPRDWRQVEVSRHFRGAQYHIRILNPTRQNRGIDRVVVDGIRQTGNVIKPFQAGSHYIEVFLG